MKTIAIRLSDVEAAMLKEVAGRDRWKSINEFVVNKIKEEFSRDPRFK